MKIKNLIFLTIFILFLHCSKKEKGINYIVFSGKVKNSSIDSLRLYDEKYKPIKTIYLTKDNKFNDTLFISSGYYYLSDWKSRKLLYLKTKFNLNSTFNYNKSESSLFFKGVGSAENNYLNEKIEFDKKFKSIENEKYYLNLNENEFLKLADSIKNQKMNFLKTFSPIDSSFLDYETFAIEFKNARLKERYKNWRGWYLKDKSFQLSADFPDPYKSINISNEKLLGYPSYLNAIKFSIEYKIKNDGINLELLSFLKFVENNIDSQKITDELAYSEVKSILEGSSNISDLEYSKFMSIVKNEKIRNELKEAYKIVRKNPKGKISPQFEFYDINNKQITLESLKGKLVYIDIWATWCFPCIREIPALKKIEEDFKNKNIYFVSMCLKDSKENFEKMVKEKKLGGIQLFAPNPSNSFFKEYNLKTIPRYILLDKEGKIIDAYASKPSTSNLREQILEHL